MENQRYTECSRKLKKMKKQFNPLRKLIDLTDGDEDFIREMLGIFIKNTPEAIANINSALMEKEYSSLSAHAHKLKSSIQILGDDDLYELIRKLENTANNAADSKDLKVLIDRLTKELNLLITWMKERLADPKNFKKQFL